jgi:hypothetical protein
MKLGLQRAMAQCARCMLQSLTNITYPMKAHAWQAEIPNSNSNPTATPIPRK